MTHKARSKGRHTTTHRELISLKNGAFVIDTPGMREIGIMNSGEGIEAAEEFFILYADIAREYIQTNF